MEAGVVVSGVLAPDGWRSCRVTQVQPITGFALFERGRAAGVVVSGVLEVMQGSRKVKVPGVVEVMPGSP